jgi:hypothetical protein
VCGLCPLGESIGSCKQPMGIDAREGTAGGSGAGACGGDGGLDIMARVRGDMEYGASLDDLDALLASLWMSSLPTSAAEVCLSLMSMSRDVSADVLEISRLILSSSSSFPGNITKPKPASGAGMLSGSASEFSGTFPASRKADDDDDDASKDNVAGLVLWVCGF